MKCVAAILFSSLLLGCCTKDKVAVIPELKYPEVPVYRTDSVKNRDPKPTPEELAYLVALDFLDAKAALERAMEYIRATARERKK